jgi:ferredoxin-like protein FixX
VKSVAKLLDKILSERVHNEGALALIQHVLKLKDPENYAVVRKPPAAQEELKRGVMITSPCGFFKSVDEKKVIAHTANCMICQEELGKPLGGAWKCERCGVLMSKHDLPRQDALLHKVCNACYNNPMHNPSSKEECRGS